MINQKQFQPKKIDEIQLHFPALPVIDIWVNKSLFFLKIATYNEAELFLREGRISQEQFEGFCAIWRNTVARFSSLAISYEF